jgi:hypothetical protein
MYTPGQAHTKQEPADRLQAVKVVQPALFFGPKNYKSSIKTPEKEKAQ